MDIKKQLMQKNGIIIEQLAKELLGKCAGDKMPTVEETAIAYQVGRGTVQTAMKRLKEMGAIETCNRGHKGTILLNSNFELLMRISGIKSLVGVMPLPYSKRYEGLATAIYSVLNTQNIHTYLAFMTGSNNRLQALKDERYDFMIISKLTAEQYVSSEEPIEIVAVLPEGSYIKHHVLLLRDDVNETMEGMKIGIDLSSSDQNFMTMHYFAGRDVQLIPILYSSIVDSINSGVIDGAIWSTDNLNIEKKGIKVSQYLKSNLKKEATQATIVVLKGNISVQTFLHRFLDYDTIKKIQSNVMKGVSMPNY